ncbi:hypothetical protein ACFLZG_04970, partial [Thermodesulfobacteriota bacterium]
IIPGQGLCVITPAEQFTPVKHINKRVISLKSMSHCRHQNLVLLPSQDKKLRCRHCHLTIGENELMDGYCPECREVYGVKRDDFEEVEVESDGEYRYCCEECGAMVNY